MGNLNDKYRVPIDIKHDAFNYQAEAVNELKDLDYCAIFHEQGLGKTKIAVDLAAHWLEERDIDTVLIVTKKQLIANWDKELKYHIGIRPSVLNSDSQNNYYVFTGATRFIVTNFETVVSEVDRLKLYLKTLDVAIIIDESAKIKNPETKLTKTFFELSDYFKIKAIMTGTPIANRPFDIWSQIYFLDKGNSLGNDFDEFKKNTNLDNDLNKNYIKQKAFEYEVSSIFTKIKSFSVRETKSSGHTVDLPSKTINDVLVDFEKTQSVIYNQVKDEMCAVIRKGDCSVYDDSSSSLKRMTRLLQIASNPKLIDDSYQNTTNKEVALDKIINKILSKNEKCIIWTNFIDNVNSLQKKYINCGAVKIHGGMTMNDRNKSVDSFQDGEAKLLFATPQAAKEGLTLTSANNAVFFDRGFNLDDYLQAQDRIHRISQQKDCEIYNLILDNSIDLWIAKLLNAKKSAAALGQGDVNIENYRNIIDYSYGDMVKDVLGIDRSSNGR